MSVLQLPNLVLKPERPTDGRSVGGRRWGPKSGALPGEIVAVMEAPALSTDLVAWALASADSLISPIERSVTSVRMARRSRSLDLRMTTLSAFGLGRSEWRGGGVIKVSAMLLGFGSRVTRESPRPPYTIPYSTVLSNAADGIPETTEVSVRSSRACPVGM